MFPGLLDTLADFDDDLYRNIKSIREPQDLFDDLTDKAGETAYAAASEASTTPASTAPLLTRPFDYGTAITFPFDPGNWHETRYSDGTRYAVWYGALALETTVHETVYHWVRFVRDSFPGYEQEINAERRVFLVHSRALLVDLRDKHREFPQLIDPDSYAFTHEVGRYLNEQHANGMLVKSARCDGINGDIFTPDVLSNPRDQCYLTYRWTPADDKVYVERKPGNVWLTLTAH